MNPSSSSQMHLDAVLNAALDELEEEDEAAFYHPPPAVKDTKETTHDKDIHSSSSPNVSEEEIALMEMMKQMKSLFPSGLSDEANIHVKNINTNNQSPPPSTEKKPVPVTSPTVQHQNASKNHTSYENNVNIEDIMNNLLSELHQVSATPNTIHTSPSSDGTKEQVDFFMEQMASEWEAKLSKDETSSQSHSNIHPEEEEDVMGQVVNGMMKQLLSKEFMYEPMKDICQQYPKWLAENKVRLSDSEYQNYGKQYQYFQRIVHLYENDPDNTERLTELMNDLQEYGQPPSELVQELAPDLEFDSDGMPKMDGMNMGGLVGLFSPTFNPEMMNGKNNSNSEDDCSIM